MNVFGSVGYCSAVHTTGVSLLFAMSTSPLLHILLFSCLLVLGCMCDRKFWTESAEAAAAGPRLAQLLSVMEALLKWLLVGGLSTHLDLPQLDFHWTHFLCSAAWACVWRRTLTINDSLVCFRNIWVPLYLSVAEAHYDCNGESLQKGHSSSQRHQKPGVSLRLPCLVAIRFTGACDFAQ